MLRSFIVALLAGWSSIVMAGSVDVRWAAPTENVDGTPAMLSGYVIEYTVDGETRTAMVSDGAATSFRLTGVATSARVTVAMRAIGDDGQRSDLSNTVTLAPQPPGPAAKPRPPVVIDLSYIADDGRSITIDTRTTAEGAGTPPLDLSAAGVVDWVTFGRAAATDVDRKAGGVILADIETIGGGVRAWHPGDASNRRHARRWTDGDPTASAADVIAVAYVDAAGATGRGWRLQTAALGATARRVRVYHGAWQADYTIRAALRDAGGEIVATEAVMVPAGSARAVVHDIDVRTTHPAATLTVTVVMSDADGNVAPVAVTVSDR